MYKQRCCSASHALHHVRPNHNHGTAASPIQYSLMVSICFMHWSVWFPLPHGRCAVERVWLGWFYSLNVVACSGRCLTCIFQSVYKMELLCPMILHPLCTNPIFRSRVRINKTFITRTEGWCARASGSPEAEGRLAASFHCLWHQRRASNQVSRHRTRFTRSRHGRTCVLTPEISNTECPYSI